MASLTAFEYVCHEIEHATSVTAPVARGTVRLALKEAGLDAATVSPDQLAVVVKELLPAELRGLRIENAEALCDRLLDTLARETFHAVSDRAGSAESVLQRLGG